jgi:cyclophilin family peptidyl-prolyl cis-trans isomerase
MNKNFSFIVVIVLIIVGIWFSTRDKKEEIIINTNNEAKTMQAILHTNKGDITIEFFDQDAPNTVANFIKLASEGFYSGVKFHRVIKGFMIQAGDPNSKDDTNMALWGQGGPGYTVPAEIKIKHTRGTVATARLGDDVNPLKASSGSQFFINVADNAFLDGNYTVFGKVVSGMEVVDEIQKVETADKGRYDRPIEAIVINSITIK